MAKTIDTQMTKLGQHALKYAERGHPVFPLYSIRDGRCDCGDPDCGSPGKHPRTMCGFKDATSDRAQVRDWWSQWPDANIGIPTGEASGLLVLDVDPRNGGAQSLLELLNQYGQLPSTLTQRTGSGGTHYIFRHRSGVGCRTNCPGPGLDIRGDGGYFIAQPSGHVSGGQYQLMTVDPPATAPQWLIDLLKPTPQKSSTPKSINRISKGERDNKLTSMAGSMVRAGFSEGAVLKALEIANRQQCVEPLPDSQVIKIASSVSKYLSGSAPTKAHAQPAFVSATDLMAQAFTEPNYAIPGLLPEGVTLLAGKPKIGKSLLAMDFVIAIAAGRKALGDLPVEQGDALYLALEDNERRLQKRLRDMLNGDSAPQGLTFTCQWPPMEQGGVNLLHSWLQDHEKAKLIVVDTLAKVRSPVKQSSHVYSEDYRALSGIKSLADEFGVAIIVIHHERKAAAIDPLDEVSGTSGLTGAADTIWLLKRERKKVVGSLFVTGRDIEEDDRPLRFDDGRWLVADPRASMSAERRAIMQVLEKANGPMGPKALADATNLKLGNVRTNLTRMVQGGQVRKPGRGLYAME